MNTEGVDRHLTTMIVRSYVQHHTVGANQLSDLIVTVHRSLGQLGKPVQPEEVLTPAVSVRRSVHQDYVVCLDCGYRGKTLRRHITTRHTLSRDQYLKRWGLRSDHPLTAPAYSERRSTLAKAFGFGRRPTANTDPVVSPTAASKPVDASQEAASTRTRRSRVASKSVTADAESDAAAAATPARKRRSRARVAPLHPEPVSA